MAVVRRPCAQCLKGRALSRYVGPKGRVCDTCRRDNRRATARRNHLLKTYGLTQEDYDALLEAQGGACAVCHEKRNYNLAVDHDHAKERELISAGIARELAARGSVRGLVCKRDNKVLRDVRDKPQILRSLADYVEYPPAQRILNAPQLVAAAPESVAA